MPTEIETPPLALRAITSLFDTHLEPLHSDAVTFVIACLKDVYPSRFGLLFPSFISPESKVFTKSPWRIKAVEFGRPGDLLLWIPSGHYPDGNAGIRIPGRAYISSTPDHHESPTGRYIVNNLSDLPNPDLVLRFGK